MSRQINICIENATVVDFIQNRRIAHFQKTQGTVIQLIRRARGFTPVVRFKDITGQEFTWTSSVSTNPPPVQVNETVDILYNLQKTQQAIIDTFFQKNLASFILFLLGGIFVIVFGILYLVLEVK